MIHVQHLKDPFADAKAAPCFTLPDGYNVRGVVNHVNDGSDVFEHPTVLFVNGEARLRAAWDDPLSPGDVVIVARIPGISATVALVILLVTVVVSVAVALLYRPKRPKLVKPPKPAAIGAFGGAALHAAEDTGLQNGASVYSLAGEKNQSRVSNVIECAYGRNKIYPSYAAAPYTVYAGNEQYQFSLFCLGQGFFSIESMLFEDTPIASFPDVEFSVVLPGESFEAFPDRVETSVDVAGIELFGPNEASYTGFTTGFVTNHPFTTVSRVEIDLVLSGGLYGVDANTGAMLAKRVVAVFQYQQVDDYNNPIGTWQTLSLRNVVSILNTSVNTGTVFSTTESLSFDVTLATNTPQRFTLSAELPPGRYQIRGVRTNTRDNSTQTNDALHWEALRTYYPSVHTYGDVTLVAVKARATNNLNNNAAAKFNVIATRKLPTWSADGGWTAPVVTRSPVWAFCDIFRARYAGRLDDVFLDLEELSELDQTLAVEGVYFDYVFDSKSTLWEAAKAVAHVARCVPLLDGSRITMLRDKPQSIVRAVFSPFNMVADSFSWHINVNSIQQYDGLEVEYVDEETWKLETIRCLLGTDQGDFLETLRLTGCTNRQRAYQEGLYHRSVTKFSKETLTFRVGVEGYIPRYGDLILVNHDVPKWGLSGFVQTIDGSVLTLSEPVTFEPNKNHRIILRRKDGTASGPYTVVSGVSPVEVIVTDTITDSFYFDNVHERPIFLFGVEDMHSRRCLVVGLKPESSTEITIDCVPYDDRHYSYSEFVAPPRKAANVRVVEPDLPVVTGLQVTATVGSVGVLTATWKPALGASVYVVETSTDGVVWSRISTQQETRISLNVLPGVFMIRVAGVRNFAGPFAVWSTTTPSVSDYAVPPADVTGLRRSSMTPGVFNGAWDAVNNTQDYEVSFYSATSGNFGRRFYTTGTVFTYTVTDAGDDGILDNHVAVRVRARNVYGLSVNAASMTFTILIVGASANQLQVLSSATGILSSSTTITADTV
jgi:hypothetical protein